MPHSRDQKQSIEGLDGFGATHEVRRRLEVPDRALRRNQRVRETVIHDELAAAIAEAGQVGVVGVDPAE
jgi:hypothetical protein